MINTKDIEVFVKDLKNVEEYDCVNCPLSLYSIKKRKYSILNIGSDFCSYWFREISGISTVGKGCTKTLKEVIKYFTKMLSKSEYKNKI